MLLKIIINQEVIIGNMLYKFNNPKMVKEEYVTKK